MSVVNLYEESMMLNVAAVVLGCKNWLLRVTKRLPPTVITMIQLEAAFIIPFPYLVWRVAAN